MSLLQHPQTGLIISWHDFSGTPSSDELGEILQQQMESGAHIGKIVTTANDYQDVLRILNLLAMAAENNFPLIAFCMGSIGKISRVATTKLGGYMTYAAPDGGDGDSAGADTGVCYLRYVSSCRSRKTLDGGDTPVEIYFIRPVITRLLRNHQVGGQ